MLGQGLGGSRWLFCCLCFSGHLSWAAQGVVLMYRSTALLRKPVLWEMYFRALPHWHCLKGELKSSFEWEVSFPDAF